MLSVCNGPTGVLARGAAPASDGTPVCQHLLDPADVQPDGHMRGLIPHGVPVTDPHHQRVEGRWSRDDRSFTCAHQQQPVNWFSSTPLHQPAFCLREIAPDRPV